ncbi:MAG: ABC transporter ATP-binding protein [Clostridia bacterium]|nr:ABC transporter ATP-binding protein [Clostridia bacterium]
MLNAEHITVSFGHYTAVEDVSFSLHGGDWLMLAGPNGAGKSTLVNALAQTVPYTGRFLLEGKDIRVLRPAALAREIGVLSQRNRVEYAYTVEEIVGLGRYAHEKGFLSHRDGEGREAIEKALELTGLTHLRRSNTLTLSGGELQRVFLAQVFAQNPRILVLDEPANHLDLKYQQHIFDLISAWRQRESRAVLSVVHDLSLARRYGTGVLLMHRGKCVAQGEMDAVLTPARLKDVYEMDVYAWMRELTEPWRKK